MSCFEHDQSRRAFLKRSGALGLAGVATPFVTSLGAIGEAAAATATDYKALVCVFLYGGNDYANTLPPYDQASYAAYAAARQNIALNREALAATVLNPANNLGGRQYALAPNLAPLLPIFNAGKMGVVLNLGTLVQPTTKQQYQQQSVKLPPKLFSHNDQQSYFQASNPEGATSGWGGRIGDVFQNGNGAAFHDTTAALGVADRVTAFTASDFGRTLVSNDDGSDHGWGSMHFVMGGAVNGRRLFGTPPAIGNGTADDVGQGRLLPTTSVDQYAATLASWFGVPAGELATVLPNMGNYNPSTWNLGFLN